MGRHREFDAEKVLDAALSVFWQKGYEGTSFEDLTMATRVARPGLYAAFGNKESFFLHALARYNEKYMGFMTSALEQGTARAVAAAILAGTIDLNTRYAESPGCLGTNGALACSDEGEPIRRELVRQRGLSEAGLKLRLDRAKEEGDLPPSADPATLAAMVMTVCQGIAVQAKAGTPKQALEAVAEAVLAGWPKG